MFAHDALPGRVEDLIEGFLEFSRKMLIIELLSFVCVTPLLRELYRLQLHVYGVISIATYLQ